MNLPDGALAALQRIQGTQHVVTIGNFDGVHLGHQHLICQVLDVSRQHDARSLVVTFEPHPVAVLRPDFAPPRISTPAAKTALLHAAGVDDVATLPFDLAFASLEPEAFVQLIVDHASPVSVIVGEGFRFGRKRAGSIETLRSIGQQCNFEAREVVPLHDAEGVVSSSRVRASLASGDVSVAEALLGRRFRLTGEVEHGMARGRDLGYPTANLAVEAGYCIPADGIYAGYAHLDGQQNRPREALIYIGTSPTFGERERLVEVNILDYRGDLYSRSLEIEFLERVRPDRKFDSSEALMAQMADDEVKSRRLLAGSTSENGRKVSDGG
jgi:riboflavin kinase / FMN adenylyltransferase